MRYYLNTKTDPAFNLAAEEYLLKNTNEDCCMLWRNHNTIVVGRNQNTLSEINPEFVRKHDINVVRRITGGGAVFHDLGNINFTFIKVGEQIKKIDFSAYTRPILGYLNQASVPARLDGLNDLTVEGLKISGNAQHIHKNRVLHHGTLLFGDFFGIDPVGDMEKRLTGCRHAPQSIKKILNAVDLERYIKDVSVEHLVQSMF